MEDKTEELPTHLHNELKNNSHNIFKDRRREEWKSNNIDKLGAALAKAQSEIKGAKMGNVNPFFKSGYANLHTVIESSFPFLSKYGLSVIQGTDD